MRSRTTTAGKYGVIRIVCGFPANADLSKAFIKASSTSAQKAQDPDGDDGHPLGKLRIETLISVTAGLSPTNILNTIRNEALVMMNSQKSRYYWAQDDPAITWEGQATWEKRFVEDIQKTDAITRPNANKRKCTDSNATSGKYSRLHTILS